jgi:hypothetical protein
LLCLPALMFWYHALAAPMLRSRRSSPCRPLTIGIALILSTRRLFRDVRHLLDVALAMLF